MTPTYADTTAHRLEAARESLRSLKAPAPRFPHTVLAGTLWLGDSPIAPALIPATAAVCLRTAQPVSMAPFFSRLAIDLLDSLGADTLRVHHVDLDSYDTLPPTLPLMPRTVHQPPVCHAHGAEKLLDTLEQCVQQGTTVSPATRMLVLVDSYPRGWDSGLRRRLERLAQSEATARAGIHIFVHAVDAELPGCGCLRELPDTPGRYSACFAALPALEGLQITLSPAPEANEARSVITRAERSATSGTDVPLQSVLPQAEDPATRWIADSSRGLRIPIGRRCDSDGTLRHQTICLELGGATTDYFAMIAGRPGYGKTVLLHDIICGAALTYSPEQLHFYLIDCTNGTGFKPYEQLPHAVFVSTTSERAYTVSALESLVREMYARADVFKRESERLGIPVEKIEDYRTAASTPMPRILVVIDEFQVLLEKNDSLSRHAADLIEKIVREGRKYGVNGIFCTQSFRNVDVDTELITLRIAFNLKESDSWKVLGGNNESATRLQRRGMAVINNCNGDPDANIYLQCAFHRQMHEFVDTCRAMAGSEGLTPAQRHVFTGRILASWPPADSRYPSHSLVFVGAPAFHHPGHLAFGLTRTPGANLMITGEDPAAALRTLLLCMHQRHAARAVVVDFSPAAEAAAMTARTWCEGRDAAEYVQKKDLQQTLQRLDAELSRRLEADRAGLPTASEREILLCLHYLQNAAELKKDGIFPSPLAAILVHIVKYGPDMGIHTLAYSYSPRALADIFEGGQLADFSTRLILRGGSTLTYCPDCDSAQLPQGRALLLKSDGTNVYDADPVELYSSLTDTGDDPSLLTLFPPSIHD